MLLKVTAADVHDKETIDDGIWIVVRRRMWETIGSKMYQVSVEDVVDEGRPTELGNDWRLEKVWYHVKQACRAHEPVNLSLSV